MWVGVCVYFALYVYHPLSRSLALSITPLAEDTRSYLFLFALHGIRCYGCQIWSKIQIMHVLCWSLRVRPTFNLVIFPSFFRLNFGVLHFFGVSFWVSFYFSIFPRLFCFCCWILLSYFIHFLGGQTYNKQYSSMLPSCKKTASWSIVNRKPG